MGMVCFLAALGLLVLGYAVYGVFVEKVFGVDRTRPTPVQSRADGVDCVALPPYKIFFIQLLNIAGLGPVFGPILGAVYGPAALLWVVFGCIFAGAVHDFLTGAMSLRYGAASYPELIGRNLGKYARWFMLVFTIWFMVLVGAVFVNGPAGLLAFKTGELLRSWEGGAAVLLWLEACPLAVFCAGADGTVSAGKVLALFFSALIFSYYFVATILPIDKIIGRIYPFFAILLLFMAFGLLAALLLNPQYSILPNLRPADFFTNLNPKGAPLWPLLFVTIACGAISGFHATQSPMMARCMRSEGQARLMFYGVMIAEGVLALIWVTIGLSFYDGAPAALMAAGTPAVVVSKASEGLLGGLVGAPWFFWAWSSCPFPPATRPSAPGGSSWPTCSVLSRARWGGASCWPCRSFCWAFTLPWATSRPSGWPSAGRTRPWHACPSGRRRSGCAAANACTGWPPCPRCS